MQTRCGCDPGRGLPARSSRQHLWSHILERGNQYAAGMQGVIQSPNWTVTRAYYCSVRLCLAIPG
jgi:hypothetical protein